VAFAVAFALAFGLVSLPMLVIRTWVYRCRWPRTAPVAGLVPVLDHIDLGASRVTDDVRRDLVAADLGGVADDPVAVYHQQGRERDARTDLTRQLVDGDDVVQRDLFLPAAAAHNRVHPRTLSFVCAS
jgi:hypothetical protein